VEEVVRFIARLVDGEKMAGLCRELGRDRRGLVARDGPIREANQDARSAPEGRGSALADPSQSNHRHAAFQSR
jgi:hypothetical protein